MADLTTNFAGIKCPNPFWLASAPPTNCGEQIMRAFDAGWGGAVWKTIGEPITKMQRPLDAAESLKHISVPVGFKPELVATEPEIGKPLAMNWDERGRLCFS